MFSLGLITKGLGASLPNEQCDVVVSGSVCVTASGQISSEKKSVCSCFRCSVPHASRAAPGRAGPASNVPDCVVCDMWERFNTHTNHRLNNYVNAPQS